MIFSSVVFIFLFLPITLYVYFLLPNRYRNYFLLLASLLFYAYGEKYFVFFMITSIVINYLMGLFIESAGSVKSRKRFLTLAIVANLLFLGFYKYTNFFIDNINVLFAYFDIAPFTHKRIHLPIGISFFTFQAISYIVDIYRGKHKAQKNPVHIALYISFFPQLIAGPIIRYKDVANQLLHRIVTRQGFFIGLERFGAGVIKKVVIANVMGALVNNIYAVPKDDLTTPLSWIAVFGFFLQDYYDFSGYSDMAIGLGRMFGFTFLENFNYPYIARSMTEFWNRWHISLQTWIRDYLFNPLGGIRRSKPRVAFNLIVVFFLAGLWHGASWNFVFFGLLQGVVLVSEQMFFKKYLRKTWRPIQHIYVLFVLMISLAMFRIENFDYLIKTLSIMFGFGSATPFPLDRFVDLKVLSVAFVGLIFSMPLVPRFKKMITTAHEQKSIMKFRLYTMLYFSVYTVMLLLALKEMTIVDKSPFIYFRF